MLSKAMATANNDSNKRRRRDSSRRHPPGNITLHIHDMPDSLLADVATYLPKTTRSFFAVAMTGCASSWQNSNWQLQLSSASKAIMAGEEPRENLDFMDIEKSCRTRLTDVEVGGLLVCTNAAHNLKSLKLTHCVGITGVGLEPLRGSTVLERIDLSLVEQHENPVIEPEPAIAAGNVVPILDSIIESEGNLLRHMQLPKKLRVEKSDILNQFLDRYDQFLHGLEIDCSKCGDVCEGTDDDPWVHKSGCECLGERIQRRDEFGLQSLTCYQCLKHFCGGCYQKGFCQCCEKNFCRSCSRINWCQGKICVAPGTSQRSSCESCIEKFW